MSPEIEWISGGTSITYTYSGGVISGYYFIRNFKVLDESGEVTINIKVKGKDNTRVSKNLSVESGIQYKVKTKGTRSGSRGASYDSDCFIIEFSSPNCLTKQEVKVSSYVVSAGGINTYYCPESLSLGEISIE